MANTMLLSAEHDGQRLELRLAPRKPPTSHGDNGLSQKGAAEGNASYYYSFTSMQTDGRLTIDGTTWNVTGDSWMDHEFSTSFLGTWPTWLGLVFHSAR